MSERRARSVPDWVGGVTMLAPLVVSGGLSDAHNLSFGIVALAVVVAELTLVAVLAPQVGFRRSVMWWVIWPIWGAVMFWRFGTRLARLNRTGHWQDAAYLASRVVVEAPMH